MKRLSILGIVAAAALACGVATAQPGPGPGASAPRAGMGMGMGKGGGPRYGSGVTPGWTMMTPEERTAHQKAMSEAKTYEECAALRDQHHQQMVDRAKEKGQTLPAQRRRDVCAGLTK
jgi:hypothetical protein